jgi:hypothetical protein
MALCGFTNHKRCLECAAPFGLVSYPDNERKFCSKECWENHTAPKFEQLPFSLRQ